MIIIDKRSIVPVYEQVINQLKALIACGVLNTGDRLESVRSLSAGLGINPNTIQKAYAELERQFICSSAPGKGRFVTADAKAIIKKSAEENTMNLDKEIYHLALSGLSKQEIDNLVQSSYNKAQNKIQAVKKGKLND